MLGLGGEIGDLPAPLPALLEGKRSNFYLHTRSILPSMRSTIYQILNCPDNRGVSRRLYLESRAIDLVAVSLAQPWESEFKRLESEDIDRIEAARQILLDRLDNPPSLMELAQQVGSKASARQRRRIVQSGEYPCLGQSSRPEMPW